MRREIWFYLGYACLLTHELDAVARAEWRVLPMTSWLSDQIGFLVFVIAHVPLFAALQWLTGHASERLRLRAQLGVSGFLVLHAALHLLFSGHAEYHFHSTLSQALIFGGAAFGALDWLQRGRRAL